MRLNNLLTAIAPRGLITCDQSVSPSSRPAMIEHLVGPGLVVSRQENVSIAERACEKAGEVVGVELLVYRMSV